MTNNLETQVLSVWDNSARLALPPGLKLWLLLLLGTALGSIFFLRPHVPARWILGGVILSHALIWSLDLLDLLVIRKGMVSLAHAFFWGPGFMILLLDREGRQEDKRYRYWSYGLLPALFVALIFDIRDSIVFVLSHLE